MLFRILIQTHLPEFLASSQPANGPWRHNIQLNRTVELPLGADGRSVGAVSDGYSA